MGGRGGFSQTYKNEMMIGSGGNGKPAKPSNKVLSAAYNPGGRFVNYENTARHAEKIIVQNNFETGIIINSDTGDVIAAYEGGRHSVTFYDTKKGTDDYDKIRGNVITHNHPSGAAAFSSDDLWSAAINGAKGIRAATKSNGTVSIVADNKRSDMRGLAKGYEKFISGGVTTAMARKWLKMNAKKYGCTFSYEKGKRR